MIDYGKSTITTDNSKCACRQHCQRSGRTPVLATGFFGFLVSSIQFAARHIRALQIRLKVEDCAVVRAVSGTKRLPSANPCGPASRQTFTKVIGLPFHIPYFHLPYTPITVEVRGGRRASNITERCYETQTRRCGLCAVGSARVVVSGRGFGARRPRGWFWRRPRI